MTVGRTTPLTLTAVAAGPQSSSNDHVDGVSHLMRRGWSRRGGEGGLSVLGKQRVYISVFSV